MSREVLLLVDALAREKNVDKAKNFCANLMCLFQTAFLLLVLMRLYQLPKN